VYNVQWSESDGISSIAATIVSATGYASSSFVGNLLLEVVISAVSYYYLFSSLLQHQYARYQTTVADKTIDFFFFRVNQSSGMGGISVIMSRTSYVRSYVRSHVRS